MARRGARRRVGGGLRAPAGAAVAAHDGREGHVRPLRRRGVRPVQRTGRRRRRAARRGADPGEPRAAPGHREPVAAHPRHRPVPVAWPRSRRRSRRRSGRPRDGPLGRRRRGGRPGGGATRAEVIERLERDGAAARDHVHLQPGRLRGRRRPAAGPERAAGPRRGGRADPAHRRGTGVQGSPTRTSASSATGTSSTGSPAGIAAHHAGMLPTFREVVEELFTAGRIRAVFATETLALGINMPARTVVLERLVKFNGEAHVDVTPAEYTQLTGRAGRRGIDIEGHAVVLWNRQLDPLAVAGLASTRTYPLRSSFRPDLQHGGQPRRPVRPRAGPGDAGDVVRPVPGRPRRRRLRADDPAQPGGAGRVRRGDAVRPGRLRRVRRHPRRDPPGGEGRRQASRGQRPRRGGGQPGEAARRRRHPHPGRPARGVRGRRPGQQGRPRRDAVARRWSPRTGSCAG